jgi:hypothetical protein
MSHKNFTATSKSMLIAPAGYGKTHYIVEALFHVEGKQLLLTHTHAGISSLKEKIKKFGIPLSKVQVETIMGYAQKYVQAFCKDIPKQDHDGYYDFIINNAAKVIKHNSISKIIAASYNGLFVDEYQDCTNKQHEFIEILATILPTRVLGDPLQGIFNFGSDGMVDMHDAEQMGDFHSHKHELSDPWRWKGKNESLGDALKEIRALLEAKMPIDLNNYSSIEKVPISNPSDLYNPTKSYHKYISGLLKQKNVLLIHPQSANINARLKIVSVFQSPISLIESIDDKEFYKIAELIDTSTQLTIGDNFIEICIKIFNKTGIKFWFSEHAVVTKKSLEDKPISEKLKTHFQELHPGRLSTITTLLNIVNKLKKVRCFRKEMFMSLLAALDSAKVNKTTVYEAMCERRNHTRRVGRKIYGRCIGTTLLTKGLEFDLVVVLNAHELKCHKNLYVAITRASQRLIICSNSAILQPNYPG